MKRILIFGAGRSSGTLIHYLDSHATQCAWSVTVADADAAALETRCRGTVATQPCCFSISDTAKRQSIIQANDFVISLLPWTLHSIVASDCLKFNKHLITASYVTPEMKKICERGWKKGLFFMGELGLDPGIDHMSALMLVDKIRKAGGRVTGFHSYAGGLVAPESDDNPWRYKFTWNPRNVVLAGQGTAQFLENGHPVFRPYNRLFQEVHGTSISGDDAYEVYANRDSLSYIHIYGMEGIRDFMRGTVRRRGFCAAWDALIRLGLTEGNSSLDIPPGMTWRRFITALLPSSLRDMPLDLALSHFLSIDSDSEVMHQLKWLGILEDNVLGVPGKTAADYLQGLLEQKWALNADDRDMVVMQHRVWYEQDGIQQAVQSDLTYIGTDAWKTAMADLVGLPLAVTTRLFLEGKLPIPKKAIPVQPEIFLPVMTLLEEAGVRFTEHEVPYN